MRHEPCPACGSSDGAAVYSSGTAFCYPCETYFKEWEGSESIGGTSLKKAPAEGCIIPEDYRALAKRNLTEETCKRYGYAIGHHQGSPCQIAPYYKNGQLVGQHLRFPDKGFSWVGDGKDTELFGQHLFSSGRRLIITEGEIDCMSISQALGNKWAVVSIPSGAQSALKSFKKHLEYIEGFTEVVISFDMDEPGQKAAVECAQVISPGKARIMVLPAGYKDANDMLVDHKLAALVSCTWEAKVYRPDGIVNGEDLSESLLDYFKNGVTKGFSSPYPELDKKTFGLHKGKILTLTAGSGIGKSTLAHEIGSHLHQEHKQRLGIVALEESVRESSLKQMSIALNQPLLLNLEGITEAAYVEAERKTVGRGDVFLYDHFGSVDSENLLFKLRYLAVACEVDFIILDHISIVVSGQENEDERKAIDGLMTNLRSLVEETGVGMILISHLKRADKGHSHEEGGRVTLGQLRGSGAIAQLSDFVVGLERDQQGNDPDVTQMRTLKNRHVGKLGPSGHSKFDHETGRLLSHELEEDCPFSEGEVKDGF